MYKRYTESTQDHIYWQKNLNCFYIVKTVNILVSLGYLIAASYLYYHERERYSICNAMYDGGEFHATGNKIRVLMILFIIYHAADII